MNFEELFTQQSSTTQPREKKSIWMIIKSETGNWRCFMFHCKFINLYSLKMNFNLNDFSNYKKNSTLCIFSKEFDILKEIEISSSSITTTTKLEYLTYIEFECLLWSTMKGKNIEKNRVKEDEEIEFNTERGSMNQSSVNSIHI